MNNGSHETGSTERAKLIDILKGGLFEVASSSIDRELVIAFQQGLERWAQSVLFLERPERVFICEFLPDSPNFRTISSLQIFSHSDGSSRLSPIGHNTVLIPSINNIVDILANEREKWLELVIKLRPESGSAVLAGLPLGAELDLYCDADDADTLGAFETLSQARWPREWALPHDSNIVWPKTGMREVQDPADVTHSAASLLNLIRHVGDVRFIRLPLRQLHAETVQADGHCEYRIKVVVGTRAPEMAQKLADKIKVNHVAFWNRHLGLIDRNPDITREGRRVRAQIDQGIPILVVECSSQTTQFVDSRWAMWIDRTRCYDFVPTDSNELQLDFKGDPPPDLRIAYLAEDDCGSSEELVGGSILRDDVQFFIRCEIRGPDSPGLSWAWWLSRGYTFPPLAHLCTESDVKRALRDLMPLPLKELYPRMRLHTVLRKAEFDKPGYGPGFFAYPVTTVTLEIKAVPPVEDLSYYCEWLSRKITSMCPLGTVVVVEAKPALIA